MPQDAERGESSSKVSAEQIKADEVKLKLEKQKAANIKLEERLRRRKVRSEFLLAFLTPKGILLSLACVVILIVLFFAVIKPQFIDSGKGVTFLSSSQLEKVVCVSKLSTAEYVYNGIAEVTNEDGKVTQRIKYDAKVNAGIDDMTGIKFEVDNDAMTVTPVLPKIVIQEPVIDTASFDYMPRNLNLELSEIVKICKQDVVSELTENSDIYKTAEENLRSTVEALTLPLISNYGYQLTWDAGTGAEKADKDPEGQSLKERTQQGSSSTSKEASDE